jgi:hypothetical protein
VKYQQLKASELVRVERDENVIGQTSLVAGQVDRQGEPTILFQDGA